MHLIDRRQLLCGAASVVSWAALPQIVRAATGALKPPVARIANVKDVYFGETINDPYRWMENDKDPEWLPFLKGQNDYARSVLDALPGREAFLKRIAQLSGDAVSTTKVQRADSRLFYQQRPLGANNYKLFVKDGEAAPRVLVDPVALSVGSKGHVSLDWWEASPDGTRVVYGLSKDGSEDSVAQIIDVATGKNLPDRIANTQAANPQWLDDSSGFFYNQLTGLIDTPERFLDSQARFHRIGDDPGRDPVVMKRTADPRVEYEKIQAPFVFTSAGAKHVVLGLADVRPEYRVYVAPVGDAMAGKANWTEVAAFADEISAAELIGDDLYLLANKGTPRGRLIRTNASAPNLENAAVIVPQGPLVIQGMSRAKDALYLKMMDGGVSRLRKVTLDGRVSDIALPFDGTIGAVFADPARDGVLISLTGWLKPSGIWSVDVNGAVSDTGLTPMPAIDVSGYETVRAFATAKDGTRIPYSLIYKKGLKRDGRNPAFISAYGSYGAAAYTPAFAGRSLALVDAGFIVGYANVRGGGEYGREWHKAGQLANKPNTWRDLIAVCESLCADKWTAPEHLAIGGRSAGGITVGRAMTERPDLFAAVIDGVGWSNPLRYVVEQNGYGEEPEWGAISDPNGYKYLRAIDSYQAVRDGVKYPAILLTTGVTDPRVAPFHVAKMTARLQAASASGKPILLRVDYDAGHGIGSTRTQQDAEAADTYAFLMSQTKRA